MNQALIDRYRNKSLSAREKAELEIAIWRSASSAERSVDNMHEFLHKHLGGSGYTRGRALLNAGNLAEPLWRLIDAGTVKLYAAYAMLRRARQIAKDSAKRLDAASIQAAIHEFESRSVKPRVSKLRVSKPLSPQPDSPLDETSKSRWFANALAVDGRAVDALLEGRLTPEQITKGRFWGRLREQLAAYALPTLQTIDDGQRDRVVRAIESTFAVFQSTIAQTLRSAASAAPNRAEILQACELLGVRPPRVDRPLDLKTARRNMHALARDYHPDINLDSPRKAELYRQVVVAFAILERVTIDAAKRAAARGD